MSLSLIYCQGGNRRAMAVARALGWQGGVRSDTTIYEDARPLALLDIEWQSPDWSAHLDVARGERPALAVIPDTLSLAEVPRTLEQGAEMAPYVTEALLIVPKAPGIIARLPRQIGGKDVRLAYSVPTTYGGTEVPLWEFGGWPVHLLGGNPRRQISLAHYMDVRSADGNMAWLLAGKGLVVQPRGRNRSLRQLDGQRWEPTATAPLEALRRSLLTIVEMWRRAGFAVARADEVGR